MIQTNNHNLSIPPFPFPSSPPMLIPYPHSLFPNIIVIMQNKYNTDIDRKLAIYYHPLFQQILTFISQFFNKSNNFTLGLFQFLQFNLKLQKSLLPTFEIENAIVSGLNDWVKEVAECLSFEGMVSTVNCIKVTHQNIQQLILNEIEKSQIELLYGNGEYKEFLKEFQNHDALKLLGVTINHEVFCKFLFDLCSTWCQFLDIELFSSFLLTLILQMTEGESLETSKFKSTMRVTCISIDFLENFENDKEEYSVYKKKELRYYRAWCEWNYLRMVEIGEKIIIDLNQLFPEDPRIPKISMLFETSIDTINEEVTLQAKGSKQELDNPRALQQPNNPKQFLIFKKLQTKNNTLRQEITFVKNDSITQQPPVQSSPNQFQIEIDEKGFMYLKPVIRIPIIGTKIELREVKRNQKKLFLLKKQQEQYRLQSNLYCHRGFYVTMKHQQQPKIVPEEESAEIHENKFYKPNAMIRTKTYSVRNTQTNKTVKSLSKYESNTKHQITQQKDQQEYIHQVMAPNFLVGKEHNMGYFRNNYQIYGSQVGGSKRNIQHNFPKLTNISERKQMTSKYIVGKFLTDRNRIRERVSDYSFREETKNPINTTSSIINEQIQQERKYQKIKEENKHIWSRYISQEELSHLTDYNEFYQRLLDFKRDFSNEFRSDYMNLLKLDIAYHDSRYEMGGVYTREDKERFRNRIAKLIVRDDRRKRRLVRKKKKTRVIRKREEGEITTKFKNGNAKELFNYVFLDYHRDKIKEIRSNSSFLK